MNRDHIILSLRPIINLDNVDTKSLELFQNNTLRPILKLQHELTLHMLKSHRHYDNERLASFTKEQYEKTIVKFVQTNLDLKNQLIGAIVALFTSSELRAYLPNKKELHKRIIQMQTKRFIDTAFPNQR